MGFVFLWTIVEMNATICDTFVFMHAILVDEEACIYTSNVMDAQEELVEFIGETLLPDDKVGIGLDEMTQLKDLTGAGGVVCNGTNESDGC